MKIIGGTQCDKSAGDEQERETPDIDNAHTHTYTHTHTQNTRILFISPLSEINRLRDTR